MTWYIIKALNHLYINGSVKKTESLVADKYIMYLIRSTKELYETYDKVFKDSSFDQTYEKLHLNKFTQYSQFLIDEGLLKPQIKFHDTDIDVLIELRNLMISKDLEEIREQINEANESLRGFSQMFFKNDKYLDTRPGLVEAVKKIIQVSDFASEKDQQYLYVLHCHRPKLIVLCENLHFLKLPTKPRLNQIELWYAGGRNIEKLKYADNRGLPIYYSCDWDYDGLDIFSSVKAKIPSIELLHPTGLPRGIAQTDHQSLWRDNQNLDNLSDLPQTLFSNYEIALIKKLISSDSWIIEESNDLIEMTNGRWQVCAS